MKKILDVCCGSRMFYFDKENPLVIFGDNRELETTLCDGRKLEIKPDVKLDFRNLPYDDNSFRVVVFDPPHLKQIGETSWMAQKYGKLGENWREDIKRGFEECWRVLDDDYGLLIFKWNEQQIKVSEILKLAPKGKFIGHKSGKLQKTHWITFIKFIKPKRKFSDKQLITYGYNNGWESCRDAMIKRFGINQKEVDEWDTNNASETIDTQEANQ